MDHGCVEDQPQKASPAGGGTLVYLRPTNCCVLLRLVFDTAAVRFIPDSSMKRTGARRWLLLAIIAAFAVSYFSSYFNRYYLGIVIDVGINIILAVSLNLINGHTGQFSLGHAGFMAVGGYTAASITLALSKQLTSIAPVPALFLVFLAALLAGGLMAAVVGL